MPQARKTLISIQDTPYYHCVSRCARRAFLCREDLVTGASYEHRRKWVENRLHLLAEVFAIDVCAYAVMSNHTHVVLHINQDKAKSWDTQEIILRWHRIHKGTFLTPQYMAPEQRDNMCYVTIRTVEETAEIWRQR